MFKVSNISFNKSFNFKGVCIGSQQSHTFDNLTYDDIKNINRVKFMTVCEISDNVVTKASNDVNPKVELLNIDSDVTKAQPKRKTKNKQDEEIISESEN